MKFTFVACRSDEFPNIFALWKDQFPELFFLNLSLTAGIHNKNTLGEMKNISQLGKCLGFNFFENLELGLRDEGGLTSYGLGEEIVISCKLLDWWLIRGLGMFGEFEIPVF